MKDSGFSVYLWRLLIFRWSLYKADISIKQTLLSCANCVQFIEIPLRLLKRRFEFNHTDYGSLLIINFFSLNFTCKEIEGKRVSSSQNERTLGDQFSKQVYSV